MAEIIPFRAFRYNRNLGDIGQLVYPMTDEITKEQLKTLQNNPYSSIHFSKSRGLPSQRLEDLVPEWKKNNIIIQDALPAIYVWYQYFHLEGDSKLYCRKGFVADVKLHEWNEKIILPHEHVIEKSVSNKHNFLEKAKLSFAPIQALYNDPGYSLESYMDEAILAPIYDYTDSNSVRNIVALIHDHKVISHFMNLISHQPIVLADGHHRYHAALQYRNEQITKGMTNPESPCMYTNMYLTNFEDKGLKILPFHREIQTEGNIDLESLLESIEEYFIITPVGDAKNLSDVFDNENITCGLITIDKKLKLVLKQEIFDSITRESKSFIYINIIQEYLIEKCIKKSTKNLKSINFSFKFNIILKAIESQKLTMAIILKPTGIREIKQVCLSGGVMPEKSTYFYPKLLAGLLFNSVDPADKIVLV